VTEASKRFFSTSKKLTVRIKKGALFVVKGCE
jgi:hypothetical protein